VPYLKKIGSDSPGSSTNSEGSEYNKDSSLPYDRTVDIWSAGCILYELVLKRTPFCGKDDEAVRKRIAGYVLHQTGSIPKNVWSGNGVVDVDIEKELDELCFVLFFHMKRKKDLCTSLEDMMISPAPSRKVSDDHSGEKRKVSDDRSSILLETIKR
jgi:serine/threonine protein kinase